MMTAIPTSLYDTCLDFIARNLDLLESLYGFPETVGKAIFHHALKLGCFVEANHKGHILKIFSDAYGDCGFLDSLGLQECHLFINDVVDDEDLQWVFQSLKQLDLRKCGLGDEHEIIKYIGTLDRLQTLVLAENSLSDDALRTLTARARMFKKNTSQLKYLDLSGNNNMTAKSIQFLHSFKKLSLVRASNTSISPKAVTRCLVNGLWSICCCDCHISSFNVSTQGWAAEVVERWKAEYYSGRARPKEAEKHYKQRGDEPNSGTADMVQGVKMFYGKRKLAQLYSTSPSHQENQISELLLVSRSSPFTCPHIQSPVISEEIQHTTKHKQKMTTALQAVQYSVSIKRPVHSDNDKQAVCDTHFTQNPSQKRPRVIENAVSRIYKTKPEIKKSVSSMNDCSFQKSESSFMSNENSDSLLSQYSSTSNHSSVDKLKPKKMSLLDHLAKEPT